VRFVLLRKLGGEKTQRQKFYSAYFIYRFVEEMVGLSLRKAGVTWLSFKGRGEGIAKGFYIPVLKHARRTLVIGAH